MIVHIFPFGTYISHPPLCKQGLDFIHSSVEQQVESFDSKILNVIQFDLDFVLGQVQNEVINHSK